MKIKHSKKWLIGMGACSPLILWAELASFSFITGLMREKSDAAVLFGLAAACAFVFLNFHLIKFIINQIKKLK